MQESGEMYLESIYVLSQKDGHVRSVDISEYMGYSKPSVSRAVSLLKSGGYIVMDKDNFQSIVKESGKTVLIDFWATWCGPCKMIAPLVEEIAAERSDIIVGKIDVDQEMDLAVQFGITSIPTLIVMKNGEKAASMVGYRPKADILKLLDV